MTLLDVKAPPNVEAFCVSCRMAVSERGQADYHREYKHQVVTGEEAIHCSWEVSGGCYMCGSHTTRPMMHNGHRICPQCFAAHYV